MRPLKFFVFFALFFLVFQNNLSQVIPCYTNGSVSLCGEQYITLHFGCTQDLIISVPSGFSKVDEGSNTIVSGYVGNTNSTLEVRLNEGYIYSIKTYYKPHPVITTSISPVCEGSEFTINSGEPSASYLTFNWDAPASVLTNESSKTISSASTIQSGYYTLSINNNLTTGCSSSTSKNITVVPKSMISGTSSASRCDGGIINLSATPSTSTGQIKWYDASGLQIATGNNYSPDLTTSTTFYVDVTDNGCTSAPRVPVVATINTTPTVSSITPNSRCGVGVLNLGATASEGIVNWYSEVTGGSLLGSGVSFLTPSISSTTSYYVEAINNNCPSSRSEVAATINIIPLLNPCANISLCGTGVADLSASFVTGTETGANIGWFTTPVGGTSLSSANPYSISIPTSTIYYAEASNANCTSPTRTPLTITVNSKPQVQYEFVKTLDCTPATNVIGINVNSDGVSDTYSWNPATLIGQNVQCLAENNDYIVTVTNPAVSCSTVVDIPVRRKFRTILVLDRTGSMGSKPAGYTFSKWELLKSDIDVLTAMINLNDITAMPPDAIAVMGYNNSQTVYSEAGSNFLPVFESVPTTTSIDHFMNTELSPSGCTSIGGALKKAIDLAGTYNDNETIYILLVTDGMQNTNPMVDISTGEIKEGTSVYYDLDDINDNIKIYCLGIGNMGSAAHDLLTAIASKGHGIYYSASEPADVSTSITDFYTAMYSGSSPKLIRFYNENLKTVKSETKEFLLNSADKINFVLSYLPGEDKEFSLKKGDDEIKANIISGNNYKMTTLKFPLKNNGKILNSSGTWTMVIKGKKANTPYKAFAIADVHRLECTFSISRKDKNLALTVTIPEAKKYLKNINVTARLLKPVVDGGDIFSNYSVSNFKPKKTKIYTKDALIISKYKTSNPDYAALTDAQAKWNLLSENKKIFNMLTPKDDSVKTLLPANSNTFEAFTNAYLSGTYKVVFVIEATTLDNEPFYRSSIKEINIFNEKFDINVSNISFIDNNPLNDIVIIKPVNNMGHVILPNSSNIININIGENKPIQVIDNLDGSFSYYFKKGQLAVPTNIFKINQGSKTVFEKQIDKIKKTTLTKKQSKLIINSLNKKTIKS